MLRQSVTPRHLFPGLHRYMAVTIAIGVLAGLLDAIVFVLIANAGVEATGGRTTLPLGLELSLSFILALALTATVLRFLSSVVYIDYTSKVTAQWGERAREMLVSQFLQMPWASQQLVSPALMQQATVQDVEQGANWLQTYLNMTTVLVSAAIGLATAAAVSPIGALATVVLAPLVVLAIRPISSRTRRASSVYANTALSVGESYSAISLVARELRLADPRNTNTRHKEQAVDLATQWRRSRFLGGVQGQIAQSIVIVVIISGILVASQLRPSSSASFAAAALIAMRASTYLQAAQSHFAALKNLEPYTVRTAERLGSWVPQSGVSTGHAIVRIEEVELVGAIPPFGRMAESMTGVSLTIRRGETIALVGPSGGGKSSLLNIIAGFTAPISGSVLVNGLPIETVALDTYWERCAIVTQDFEVLPGSVQQNLSLFLGRPSAYNRDLLAELFPEYSRSMDQFLATDARVLSGGQKQRLSIARAFSSDRDLLLLDEPTSALDSDLSAKLSSLVERFSRGGGMTVLITHNPEIADFCASTVIVGQT
jgi:subfamily B ATP-binding cassette protein MsbA